MRKGVLIFTFVCVGLLLLIFVRKESHRCTTKDCGNIDDDIQPKKNIASQTNLTNQDLVLESRLLTDSGGRVDWYKGKSHNKIAYDAVVDDRTKNTEVFTIEPDGTNKKCVTCDSEIPKGFIGQPAWHPDGKNIIVQAENENSQHRIVEHVSFGANNDLWIINYETGQAKRLWSTDLNHAALHPHFSPDGTKLIFAERVPTGDSYPMLGDILPGSENIWDGWQIRVANYDPTILEITDSYAIQPNGKGFYETSSFFSDTDFTYSFTPNGEAYCDDIFTTDLSGKSYTNLINNPGTWEEHASFYPDGSGSIVFISSRVDPNWKSPGSKASTLSTELYTKTTDGEIAQLTKFNSEANPKLRYIASDYDWSKDGKQIAVQIAPVNKKTAQPSHPQIWILTLK